MSTSQNSDCIIPSTEPQKRLPANMLINGNLAGTKLKFVRIIASGEFGTCIETIKDNKPLAVKIANKSCSSAKRELDIYIKLNTNRTHIPYFAGYCYNEESLYIYMELFSSDLLAFLADLGDYLLEAEQVIKLVYKVILGVCALNAMGYSHTDIKHQNILVKQFSNGYIRAVITDFGSSMTLVELNTQFAKNTIGYSAPELVFGMPSTYSVDTYSIICVAFELYSGEYLNPSVTTDTSIKIMHSIHGLPAHIYRGRNYSEHREMISDLPRKPDTYAYKKEDFLKRNLNETNHNIFLFLRHLLRVGLNPDAAARWTPHHLRNEIEIVFKKFGYSDINDLKILKI